MGGIVVKCGDLGSGYTYAIIQPGASLYLYTLGGGGQTTQGIQAIGVLDVNSHFKFIRLVDGSYALQTPTGLLTSLLTTEERSPADILS